MKKIISGLLGILFVVLVVVGVFICTYVFNQPSRSGDSRELISGTWTDKDANITFEFSDEGDKVATCKFIFQNSDGVYSCERKDSDGSFYDGK